MGDKMKIALLKNNFMHLLRVTCPNTEECIVRIVNVVIEKLLYSKVTVESIFNLHFWC